MAAAPSVLEKNPINEFDPHATSIWSTLSEENRQTLFKLLDKPIELKQKMGEFGLDLDAVSPTDIRWFYDLENDIQQKNEVTEELNIHEKDHKTHAKHVTHRRHHAQFEPSMHAVFKEDTNYQDIHKQETKKYEDAYLKKYKKLPTQQQIHDNVNAIAEAKFRKNHKETAEELEKNESNNTSAQNASQDVIAIQYQQQAALAAKDEIQRKKLKIKLKKGKITPEEYKKQANAIYAKHSDFQDIQFAQKYKEKAAYFASIEPLSRPRFTRAIKTITNGRAYRKAQQKKKRQTNKLKPLYTPIQQQKVARATTVAATAIPKLPKGAIGTGLFKKQLKAKLPGTTTFIKGKKPKTPLPAKAYGTKNPNYGGASVLNPQALIDAGITDEALYGGSLPPQQPIPVPEQPNEQQGSNIPSVSDIADKAKQIKNLVENGQKVVKAITWLANPYVLAAIGIILLIIILIAIIMAILNQINNNNNANANNIPGFTMTIDGPDNVPNGTANTLNYTINITYSLFDSIQITNQIPAGAVCAPGIGYTCNGNNDIVWNLDKLTPIQRTGDNKIYKIPVSFTVAPTTKDANIVENVIADDLTAGTGNTPVPGLTLTVKTDHTPIANGEIFDYVIDATYTGKDPTVQIFANVPPHTQLLGQPTGPKVTDVNGLITWVMSDYGSKAEFLYRVKPDSTLNDSVLTNTVYATARGTGTGSNIVWLNSGFGSPQFNGNGDGWITAQCSQASLTEIFNAYKKPTDPQLKIADVEAYGQSIGVWDPINGLDFQPTAEASIRKEVDHFGFKVESYTDYKQSLYNPVPAPASLDAVINTANQGHPVMISAPNHWLVLWKGDATKVDLLDSSGWNLTWAPNEQNIEISKNDMINGLYDIRDRVTDSGLWYGYWTGIAVVIVPK